MDAYSRLQKSEPRATDNPFPSGRVTSKLCLARSKGRTLSAVSTLLSVRLRRVPTWPSEGPPTPPGQWAAPLPGQGQGKNRRGPGAGGARGPTSSGNGGASAELGFARARGTSASRQSGSHICQAELSGPQQPKLGN